jgi:hypothetical protein
MPDFRRTGYTPAQILATLEIEDEDDDNLPDVEIEEDEEDDEILETEEVHYHVVDVLVENEVRFTYRSPQS